MWTGGHGIIKPNPAYGTKINFLFLDTMATVNEQLVDEPTISDITVVPGMSDHVAITVSI